MWSSKEFTEQIVPEEYLYAENAFPNTKISGFDLENVVLGKFEDNALAFKNSKQLFLSDIPLDYKGLPCLKFNARYHEKSIKFKINAPTYVYVAVATHYPNPLPDYFNNTQEMLQIIEVKPTAKPVNVTYI